MSENDTQQTDSGKDTARIEALLTKVGASIESLRTSEGYLGYLRMASTFHTYSANNVLLIWAQRPDATLVAGYQAWKAKGRQVRKGSKGIAIIRPFVGPDQENPEKKVVRAFGTTHVFDITDTDVIEGGPWVDPPERPVLEDHRAQELLDLLMFRIPETLNIEVNYTMDHAPLSTGAMGWSYPAKREVYVRMESTPANQLDVLLHELGHVEDPAIQTDTNRDTREFVAESVAHVVAEAIGLDTSEAATWYLASWKADTASLLALTKRIGKAASRIIPVVEAATAEVEAGFFDRAVAGAS